MSTTAATTFLLSNEPHENTGPQPRDPLLADLKGVFRRHCDAHPRSQQKALGPSEIGHPCPRKLASAILDLPAINPDGDPLPSWLGTAGHTRLEEALNTDNTARLAQGKTARWITEHRVEVRTGLSGTCDLYDCETATVIDHKFPGPSRFQTYKRNGPPPQYRIQAHAYGRGFRNEGLPVEHVAIWFIPRGGAMASSFLWKEPYNDHIIDQALQRLDHIMVLLNDFDIEHQPPLISLIPKHPHDCTFCPWFSPNGGNPAPHACRGGYQ